jgi:hypothetical protein
MDVLKKSAPHLSLPGLFPIYWDRTTGNPSGGKFFCSQRQVAYTNTNPQTRSLLVLWQIAVSSIY